MKVQPFFFINALESNIMVFRSLLTDVEQDQAHWKPSPDQWCLLEIVCHLVDEEIFDFRKRVQTALQPDTYPFEPIDPVGWVQSKKYRDQDFTHKTDQWAKERQKSIDWLHSLNNPDWKSFLQHPDLGPMSARLFLANWVAHDHIHIRQINRTKRAYLKQVSGEDLSYAGTW